METISIMSGWTEEKRRTVAEQMAATEILAESLGAINHQLSYYDKVEYLRMLKKRIMEQVEQVERMEMAAQAGNNQASILGGIAAFAIGTILAGIHGNRDAPQVGLKSAASVLNRETPFGTVLIAVGNQELIEDVKIVPLSRLARESDTSEAHISSVLEKRGYKLMTPEVFFRLLDQEENKLASGNSVLIAGTQKLNQLEMVKRL